MSVRTIIGDCRDVLRTLPDESVHCCVTSPPYWGLRDYGVSGQIGLESTFTEFIDQMVTVFREVRRVLRSDGTLWLNLGDSYASTPSGSMRSSGLQGGKATQEVFRLATSAKHVPDGLKPKDLCGIPWRVALALQADGWWLRQDIIWSKPNPMPESVTDRCTKAHEYVFLMSKSARYYFDAEAIREAAEYGRRDTAGEWRGGAYVNQRGSQSNSDGNGGRNSVTGKHPETGRNKRSVWEIATAPFSEAHFATFPPALIEPCIKAGTSEKGCCSTCGAPWVRESEKTLVPTAKAAKTFVVDARDASADRNDQGSNRQKDGHRPGWINKTETLGWSPSCKCNAPVIPCTVLDPFGGAGTTALVADRLQRNAIIIELNPAYATMAERRVFNDAPLLQGVAAE